MENEYSSYKSAIAQLPLRFKHILENIPGEIAKNATEIRLRSGRPIVIRCFNTVWYISKNSIAQDKISESCFVLSHENIGECFKALCAFSVHSYENYIKMGFIPLPGGHRVGISGTAICDDFSINTIKNISSLNIRIARTKKMPCDESILQLVKSNSNGIILAGEPGSGKTTVLRSIMHLFSEENLNISIVDERFEISPISNYGFCEEMPVHCDVLSGYPKHLGMLHALRSLAPDIIICDEIGSFEDVHAVKAVANAGVKIIVSMHAENLSAIKRRPQAKEILQTGAFDKIIFLCGKKTPGKIREVIHFANDV